MVYDFEMVCSLYMRVVVELVLVCTKVESHWSTLKKPLYILATDLYREYQNTRLND